MSRRSAAGWALLGVATLVVAALLGLAGLPSPMLFAAMLAGIAAALTRPGALVLPEPAFRGAQAVLGVALGAYLQSDSLAVVARSWPAVTVVSTATLALSIGAGLALARYSGCDRATASLGMVAGGASGIVAMADELGADGRLVAFMQYARVLVVVAVTPLVAAVFFGGGDAGPGVQTPLLGDPRSWLILVVVAGAGVTAGSLVRLPSPWLLGPLIATGAITLGAPALAFEVPALPREGAFGLLGAYVGLRFTTETVRQAGRLLAPVLVSIAGLMVACLGMAVVLDLATSVTLGDAYLATTPGGLYAVAAVAFGAGTDTTFVLAVQSIRVLVMVLLAPFVVRWLARSRDAA